MKIYRVRYSECGGTAKPFIFDFNSVDLSGEEYAELRFLVELSRIMEKKRRKKIRNGSIPHGQEQRSIFLVLHTDRGIWAEKFCGQPPVEIEELCEFLRNLRQTRVSTCDETQYSVGFESRYIANGVNKFL